MKTLMTASAQARLMAGTVAALAALFTMGGSLYLAGHYAQTGASRGASGYYAAGQTARIDCSRSGNFRTAAVPRRRGAESS